MSDGFKKYDSQVKFTFFNARLTEDAKLINPEFLKLTCAAQSAMDNEPDMWLSVLPYGKDIEMAQHLKKGDVLSFEGFPALRKWGTDGDKTDYVIKFPKLHYPLKLVQELNQRRGEAPVAKPAKKAVKAPPVRGIINLDDDE